MSDKKAVVVLSGGLDSTVLAYFMADQAYDLHCVSFNYGQRHAKELEFAAKTSQALAAKHTVVDLTNITMLLGTSSLTNPDIPVPNGWYSDETMKITVVPNRNMIMIAIAGGIAVAEKAEKVCMAVHGGDHFIYPDCRREFITAANDALFWGNDGFAPLGFELHTPFLFANKSFIVNEGHALGVPFADTWSCYKGGERHCGVCGTCNERKEAFAIAEVDDPTDYEVKGFTRVQDK